MLKLEGVRAGYGAIEVLKGIDLHVEDARLLLVVAAAHRFGASESSTTTAAAIPPSSVTDTSA